MRNHTGDPELGLFSWHLWSHLVGAPIIHGPMRCGKSPIVPHFYTSSGSRATDTPDFPIWQAFYSFKQGGIFPNFKISVCPLLHFSVHGRLTVCSEMAWWKTWKTHRVQWDGIWWKTWKARHAQWMLKDVASSGPLLAPFIHDVCSSEEGTFLRI